MVPNVQEIVRWESSNSIDRSKWPIDGPWVGEPDIVEFIEKQTGYLCTIKRNSMGAWCGYVDLPARYYISEDSGLYEISVQGGVTYSDTWNKIISCVDGKDTVETTWRVGFDCAHAGDFSPGLTSPFGEIPEYRQEHEIYRDKFYAANQCVALAHQLFPDDILRMKLLNDN